jgi:hypothetical protein
VTTALASRRCSQIIQDDEESLVEELCDPGRGPAGVGVSRRSAQRHGDPLRNEAGVGQRRQLNVPNAVREALADGMRRLQRKTGLADAARPGQRDESMFG